MAWIESHQQLERHPKTHVLMNSMGWDIDTAIGKLHRFWWWVLDFAPTGDLRKFNDATLGGSVGLSGTSSVQFVRAMIEACWLDRGDGVFRVHDWPHYAGRYLKDSKFKRSPDKWKEVVELYDKPCPRTVCGLSPLPNQPTVPTKPNQPVQAAGAAPIPDNLQLLPGFLSEWQHFKLHRKRKRAAMTPRAEELILEKLSLRPSNALDALKLAQEAGWTGFEWEWFDKRKTGPHRKTEHQRDAEKTGLDSTIKPKVLV